MTSFNDQVPRGNRSRPNRDSPRGNTHHYYADNYTSDRPPHLNDDNFSSTQPGGSASQPRRAPSVHVPIDVGMGSNVQHYPSSFRSANTNSTMKAGDPLTQQSTNTTGAVAGGGPFEQRAYLAYYLSRNYDTSAAPSLTTQAVAALDHSNETGPYNGNIHGWLPGAGYNVAADPAGNNWSVEYLPMAGSSGRHSSVATNHSWTMVPSHHHDPRAENIYGVGEWQTDVAADPKTILARCITDEDTQDLDDYDD
ncbi:hypothetical protein GGR53DRAFT_451573 [Hypoxylon sp. FL1150]|nr:hypothetical protein GGR53DRAFT_451573 [Hypoxylon sp. FL1150]